MKTKLYMLGAAMVMLASVSFTACSDDDDAPVASTPEELVVPTEAKRIKIGTEFRMPLSELTLAGAGEYNAYSLNPEIADVETDEDGSQYVAGYKNGTANIVLSDAAGKYKKVTVAVYTTEEMKLNHSYLDVALPVNQAAYITGFAVAEGNGDYTVASDNSNVSATINAETGVMSIIATATEEPYTSVICVTDCTGLTAEVNVTVAVATARVKIGADTRAALNIDSSKGEFTAESLDPTYATVVEQNGQLMVEGLRNGKAIIRVEQGEYVYVHSYSVYTTDVMKLNVDAITVAAPMGLSASNTEIEVTEGNGEYSVTSSDGEYVYASINRETGKVTLTCRARKAAYAVTITVTDCTGLTADATVTVESTMDPFTQSDIDEILAQTDTNVFGQVKDPSDGTQPYYWMYRRWYGGDVNTDDGTTRRIGWWLNMWGTEYGGLYIDFPSSAAVEQEVSGSLTYAYSSPAWGWGVYTYDGTVKLLEDNDTRTVAIFWNIDMDNERINRGYVIMYK